MKPPQKIWHYIFEAPHPHLKRIYIFCANDSDFSRVHSKLVRLVRELPKIHLSSGLRSIVFAHTYTRIYIYIQTCTNKCYVHPYFFQLPENWMFPKIGVGPKWMVKIMVPNPMNKLMIWGVFPLYLETPNFHLFFWLICFPKSTNAQNFLRQENNPVAALSDMMARDLGGSQIGSCHGCLGDLLGMKNYPVIWGL